MVKRRHSNCTLKHAKLWLLLFLFLTSCATYLNLPYKDEIWPGEPLPIDGAWVNPHGYQYRISKGIFFVDDPGIGAPLRKGHVSGKNITQISRTKYEFEYAIYWPKSGIIKYIPAEFEVIGPTALILRSREIKRIGWKGDVKKYTMAELDDPDWFMAQLKTPAPSLPEDTRTSASQQ